MEAGGEMMRNRRLLADFGGEKPLGRLMSTDAWVEGWGLENPGPPPHWISENQCDQWLSSNGLKPLMITEIYEGRIHAYGTRSKKAYIS